MEESMEEIGGKTGDAFMLEMKFNSMTYYIYIYIYRNLS